MFKTEITPLGQIGSALAIFGAMVYSLAKVRGVAQTWSEPLPRGVRAVRLGPPNTGYKSESAQLTSLDPQRHHAGQIQMSSAVGAPCDEASRTFSRGFAPMRAAVPCVVSDGSPRQFIVPKRW